MHAHPSIEGLSVPPAPVVVLGFTVVVSMDRHYRRQIAGTEPADVKVG
jgi:hypothetical protein